MLSLRLKHIFHAEDQDISKIALPFIYIVHLYYTQSRTVVWKHRKERDLATELCLSEQASLPPATCKHHMIRPPLQKLGERSQRSTALRPGKTGNILFTNPPMPKIEFTVAMLQAHKVYI